MFQELLERLARALEKRKLDYMLIGGQAVLLYGEPRLTRDVDITLGAGPERLPEVLEMVRESGWKVLVEDPKEFVRRTMVLPVLDPESTIRLDFIFSFSAYEQKALKRVRKVKIGQTLVRFAALEDLVIHKIVAGRPRDLEDVRGILLKNPSADRGYIYHWLEQFEQALNRPLLREFDRLWNESRPQGPS